MQPFHLSIVFTIEQNAKGIFNNEPSLIGNEYFIYA